MPKFISLLNIKVVAFFIEFPNENCKAMEKLYIVEPQ